jgi:hypothetical protein
MDIINTILTVIISVGFTMTIVEIKGVFTKEAKDMSDGLDLLDLEARIEAIESGVKAHIENIRILSSRITDLEVDIINLKNQTTSLERKQQNSDSSINNFIPFMDKTRGMAEENARRLDDLQKGE